MCLRATYPCRAFSASPWNGFAPGRQPALHELDFVRLRAADARSQGTQIFVLRMRRNHRRHLHRLGMMQDHALHELHVRRRPWRQDWLASTTAAFCSAHPAHPVAPPQASPISLLGARGGREESQKRSRRATHTGQARRAELDLIGTPWRQGTCFQLGVRGRIFI